jgi:hypothetical protein
VNTKVIVSICPLGGTFPKLISDALFRGAIDDRAIHVNATSTRMCLFGAFWHGQCPSMTGGVGTKKAQYQRFIPKALK